MILIINMMILDSYHNFTNLDLLNVLFLTLGITGLSLLFSGWNYFQNKKNIDLKENVKSIFSVLPFQIPLTFICLSFILYSSAKIYLNLDIDLDFTGLKSIPETSSDFSDLISNIVTYLVTSFILPFTEKPLKDYAGLCFVTITFGLASLWYLLTNVSKDDRRKESIIKFCCYFGVIGFLWFYKNFDKNVDPLQNTLEYTTKAYELFVEKVRAQEIPLYLHEIYQGQSICNFLLIIINILFFSVFDDWLIINGYRILTNGVTTRYHTIKIIIFDYMMALSIFIILFVSGIKVSHANYYLYGLINEPFLSSLNQYGFWSILIGCIGSLYLIIILIIRLFLVIVSIPIFILNLLRKIWDSIKSMFKNNSSEVTTETEES